MAKRKKKTPKGPRAFPLADLMLLKGVSQRQLSLRTGIAASRLADIKNGHHSPTWGTVLRICTAIDADLGDLRPRRGGAA